MNDIPETDEELLRTRLHKIGAAIEQRHVAGRDDLFEPRRPRRLLVSASVAAAVVALVAAGLLIGRGSDGGTKTATGPSAPAALERLLLFPMSELVNTPMGILVVSGSHGGHPAVYAPDSNGVYDWHVERDVPPLAPVSAWMDGTTLRVVGHRCPTFREGTVPATHGVPDTGCPSAPLMALGFDSTAGTWSKEVHTVDTHGKVTDIVAGDGLEAVAMMTEYPQQQPLGLIDLESGSITDLTETDNPPNGVSEACVSGDTFLVVRRNGSANSVGVDAGADGDEIARKLYGIDQVERVDGSRLTRVSLDGIGLAEDADWYWFGGCVDGGMLVQPRWTDGDHALEADVVALDPSTGDLTTRKLPDPPFTESETYYSTDLTGSTIQARVDTSGPDLTHATSQVAFLDSAGQWRRLQSNVATSSPIAVDSQGNVYRPISVKRTSRPGEWRLQLVD